MDGFVDEEVVTRLMQMPYATREVPHLSNLVLAANDYDFAGWRMPAVKSPFIAMAGVTPAATATFKRAKPPEIDEPGIGQPVRSGHRWWLAGVAGMMSTFLFSLLLLFLSDRNFDTAPLVVPAPLERAPQPAEPSADSGPEITLHHATGGI